jgi:hypothetical protein
MRNRADSSAMLRRFVLVLGLVAVIAVFGSGRAIASSKRAAKTLEVSNLLKPAKPFRDRVLSVVNLPQHLRESPALPYRTSDGMTVYVSFSDYHTADPAVAQAEVNLLGFFVHGTELNGLVVHIFTPAEISAVCGTDAIACYISSGHMYVAGEDSGGVPVEQALAHEYGHRIAAYRSDDPWPAFTYGPKRWATYEGVCPHVFFDHDMFPGDEGAHYAQNPGEGWAEAYRRLNENRAGWTPLAWQIVDPYFVPDNTALGLITQDVTAPWTGTKAYGARGRLRRNGTRRYRLEMWDGVVRARVSGRARATVTVLSHGHKITRAKRSVATVACGDITLTFSVHSVRGGPFALSITAPTD